MKGFSDVLSILPSMEISYDFIFLVIMPDPSLLAVSTPHARQRIS